MDTSYLLPLIWMGLLGIAVLAYVVADGFDLGCGILFAVESDDDARNVIVNSVAPVWDGNETWLVLGGGGLFAVFPLAYSIIMPAFYPTIIGMLLALIFRGVAFEFRFRAATRGGRRAWDFAFCAGSLVAALCQGLTLGGLLQGIHVADGRYAGGWFDWLDAFTVFCGLAAVFGYALNGAAWLVWRTEGRLQQRCRGYARVLAVVVLGCIVVVSAWSPLLDADYARRWFAWPEIAAVSPVPILVAVLAWVFFTSLKPQYHIRPFLCVLGWIVLCFAGLAISVFPHIVPPDITIWDAAAPPSSQEFLLVGASVLIPIILIYTGIGYFVFRGKVTHESHYH